MRIVTATSVARAKGKMCAADDGRKMRRYKSTNQHLRRLVLGSWSGKKRIIKYTVRSYSYRGPFTVISVNRIFFRIHFASVSHRLELHSPVAIYLFIN